MKPREVVIYREFEIWRVAKSKWKVRLKIKKGFYLGDHSSLKDAQERCDRIIQQTLMGVFFVAASKAETIILSNKMPKDEVDYVFKEVRKEFRRGRWRHLEGLCGKGKP